MLLPQVGGGVRVAAHRELLRSAVDKRLDRAGDEVVVLDVDYGQVRAHHPRHLPGVATGGVHDHFRHHHALFGDDFPFA